MHKSLFGAINLKIVQVMCAYCRCKDKASPEEAHERSPTVPRAWESQTGKGFTVRFRQHNKTSVKGIAYR